jgi:XTP/dITP diphosphohydrolase
VTALPATASLDGGRSFGWPTKLVLATHNAGKAREFRALLPPQLQTITAGELALAPPDEDGGAYLANARLKAAFCAAKTGLPALADDTGAEIDALAGAPGVETASWVAARGGWSPALEYAARAVGLTGSEHPHVDLAGRGATLRCALVLRWPDGRELAAEASVRGRLRWPPSGPPDDGFATMFSAESTPAIDPREADLHACVQPHRRAAFAALLAGARADGHG